MSTFSTIVEHIEASILTKNRILSDEKLMSEIKKSAELIIEAYKNGNKVLFAGNGGSASDAQHLSAELSGRFYFDRPPLPAEALHCNTSYLTAVANDYGYDEVFARMIKGSGQSGDVLVGLSTSGNSPNILKAFETAKSQGLKIIAFTGETGGEMKNLADILLNVPSMDTPRIQESHILIGHIICCLVEDELFGHLKR